jgi:hypothetical protein
MKKIPKKLLDDCIEASRNYWNCYNDTQEEMRRKLAVYSGACDALGHAIGVDWVSVQDFFSSILRRNGFYNDAENDEIYCALRCIGWMPVDE